MRMSRERAPVLIIGLSPILETARKLQISWGVYSIHAKQDAQNATEMVSIACKALKNEGYKIILVNSNPATIMTDPDVADKTYIEPITPEILKKI